MLRIFLLVLHLMVTLMMIGVIFLQKGEDAGGGGGHNAGIFTARSGRNPLTTITGILGGLFFTLCIVMAVLTRNESSLASRSILGKEPPAKTSTQKSTTTPPSKNTVAPGGVSASSPAKNASSSPAKNASSSTPQATENPKKRPMTPPPGMPPVGPQPSQQRPASALPAAAPSAPSAPGRSSNGPSRSPKALPSQSSSTFRQGAAFGSSGSESIAFSSPGSLVGV
jgi:preprotein translocase subunit SecG